jgi:hypothetical protein
MTTELDNLAGLAAEADQAAVALTPAPPVDPNAPPEPPPPPGPEEQAVDLVNMFAGLVIGYAPAAADIWTPQAKEVSAQVLAPVMVKYGFSMTAFPPELAAAIVIGPLLYRSSTMVADKIKADRAAAAAPAKPVIAGQVPAPVGAPAGPDGAPAAGVHEQMKLYAK